MSAADKSCRLGIILLASLSICGQTASVEPPPQPLTVEGATTYVYKTVGKDELRLHVFKPDRTSSEAKAAAIVFFFGGAWTAGSVNQFTPQARYLAQRGMVAIVADYRVFARHGTTPFQAISDAKSTLRWVRAHSAQLGIDPKRIAAAGGSAGGHLAVSTAVFDTFDEDSEDKTISAKPNALVLFNPAVDTTHPTPTILVERVGGRGRDASPLHHLRAGLPPTIIFHGKSDTTVPYADVERFCAAAKALGSECKLIGYEGATHGFFNPQRDEGKWYRETLQEVDKFLTHIGYLKEPTAKQAPR